MPLSYRHDRLRRCRPVATLLVAVVMLAGCSSSSGTTGPDSSSWTGRLSNIFSGSSDGASSASAAGAPAFDDNDCPSVDIRPGASTLSVAAKADQPTANDLRYQLSFSRAARQCVVLGATMTIKVGVQGRVILGPAGGPGQVSVPLRYAVVHEGPNPKTIVTKFKRLPVTVAPGETNVTFTDVEDDLTFPMPPLVELQAYIVYIGFDDLGEKNEKKKPARTAKKQAPKRK